MGSAGSPQAAAVTHRLPDPRQQKKWPGGWGPHRPGEGEEGLHSLWQDLCQDLVYRSAPLRFAPSQREYFARPKRPMPCHLPAPFDGDPRHAASCLAM